MNILYTLRDRSLRIGFFKVFAEPSPGNSQMPHIADAQ